MACKAPVFWSKYTTSSKKRLQTFSVKSNYCSNGTMWDFIIFSLGSFYLKVRMKFLKEFKG